MKKKIIITVVLAAFVAAGIYFAKQSLHAEKQHVHGEECTHDQDEHAENEHVHGKECADDHADDHNESAQHADESVPGIGKDDALYSGAHNHEEEHSDAQEHVHGEECNHDQEAPVEAVHVHGEECAHSEEESVKDDLGHQHAEGESCSASDDTVSFEISPRREKLLGIKTVEARMASLQDALSMPGRFEWDQSAVRSYGVPVVGFADIMVKVPQRVKAGDALFVVDSVELQRMVKDAELAGKSLHLIETGIEVLKRRIASIKESGSRNAELEMDLAVKQAELEQAVVKRDALDYILKEVIPEDAKLERGKIVVRALNDGFVTKVGGVSGEWCESGRELVRVVRSGGLRFKAEALFSDSVGLRNGLVGEVEPTSAISDSGMLSGTIHVGFADDAGARVMPVYVDFKELPEWVRPSMPGVLRVATGTSQKGNVVVPETCVVNSGVDQVVFVAAPSKSGRYFIRKVTVGISDGDRIEIASGLTQGDRVVSAGVYQLRQEFATGEGETKKEAGHFHADGEFHVGEH